MVMTFTRLCGGFNEKSIHDLGKSYYRKVVQKFM